LRWPRNGGKKNGWRGDKGLAVLAGGNVHYEIGPRSSGIAAGGIGAVHLMVQKIGLVSNIQRRLFLLKIHLPYCEADHVLNIAYNLLVGGTRLEHIEMRRQDEAFLDALGAARIPDPTTAGDFCRRLLRKMSRP
jgi:hypothetical protein